MYELAGILYTAGIFEHAFKTIYFVNTKQDYSLLMEAYIILS